MYAMKNKDKKYQTASPSKYPQGYFKDKPCRECGTMFSPLKHHQNITAQVGVRIELSQLLI